MLETCTDTGKIIYITQAKAYSNRKLVVKRRKHSDEEILSVYRCKFCQKFHLGRPPR